VPEVSLLRPWLVEVLNAQQSLSDSISSATSSLASLGVTRDEVRQLVEPKIRAYAANLFGKLNEK
jgi:hypothetical protein